MKKKITILTIAICLTIAILMITACDNDTPRGQFIAPTDAMIAVTYHSIEIEHVSGLQGAGTAEFSLNGTNWQNERLFSNLQPNTQYSVHIRQQANEAWNASESLIRNVTTLRRDQEAVTNVTYTQSNRTITLVGATAAMEVAFDGVNFGNETTHTFTADTNGYRTIRVRYRQTEQANASEAQEISVRISNFYGGRGTAQNPFQVKTFDQLQLMTGAFYFALVDDIQFPNEAVSPINVHGVRRIDGNNFSLLQPRQNRSLFYAFTSSGNTPMPNIVNLNVVDTVFTMNEVLPENQLAGGGSILAGVANNATIQNVHISGSVVIEIESTIISQAGFAFTFGAIAGTMNNGHIIDSSADISLSFRHSAVSNGTTTIGGLLGRGHNTTIRNSYANVDFDISDVRRGVIGGLAGGWDTGQQGVSEVIIIENSFATGQIAVRGEGAIPEDVIIVGGVVGRTTANIAYLYSTIDISVSAVNQSVVVGGIAGLALSVSDPMITNAFFAGSIAVATQWDSAGFINWRGSIVNNPPRPNSVTNSYFIDTLVGVSTTNGSTAVSEANLNSITWQRANLNFDEEIWQLTDGQLPILR